YPSRISVRNAKTFSKLSQSLGTELGDFAIPATITCSLCPITHGREITNPKLNGAFAHSAPFPSQVFWVEKSFMSRRMSPCDIGASNFGGSTIGIGFFDVPPDCLTSNEMI